MLAVSPTINTSQASSTTSCRCRLISLKLKTRPKASSTSHLCCVHFSGSVYRDEAFYKVTSSFLIQQISCWSVVSPTGGRYVRNQPTNTITSLSYNRAALSTEGGHKMCSGVLETVCTLEIVLKKVQQSHP